MTPNLVFVGATENARALIERALASGEVSVLGVFDDRRGRAPESIHGVPVLGDLEALLSHRILPYVDRIVITVTTGAQDRLRELIARLRSLPNEVTLFIDVEGGERPGSGLSRVTRAPLAFLPGRKDDERRAFDKRVQDLVVASVGLVLAAPIMLVLAIAVKLDSPGPVLFRQRRHGFNNEVVTVWKFRSMRHDLADATASRQVTADDERITRLGRFIRQTSLDELPQLFNVLRGEMSVVGPRPHAIGMMSGRAEACRLVAEYAWRHRMKPGITGWAQINGSRGPVHTAEDVRRRVALDIEYIERQSLRLDLWIMLMTLPRLLGDRLAVR
jgi:Undecaprenyl-phosphate glucose phosphotransferase